MHVIASYKNANVQFKNLKKLRNLYIFIDTVSYQLCIVLYCVNETFIN